MSSCDVSTCTGAPYIGPSIADTCHGTFILFMAVLNNFLANTCSISELRDRIRPQRRPDDEYDFIVIGGGSSGSTVSGRLVEIAEWKVLLLEAGNDEPPGSQVPAFAYNFNGGPYLDWRFQTEPSPYACLGYPGGRCNWPRGKVLGGTSVINGMMYIRGVRKDYDDWVKMGNPGWSWEDVFPIFLRSENNLQIGERYKSEYHSAGGPLSITQFNDRPKFSDDLLSAAVEVGYNLSDDLNGERHTGFTIAQATNADGVRVSAAKAFLRPKRNYPNLHVMLNSTVTKIVVENTNGEKKATAVEFVYDNVKYVVKAKKEVIVSGGAVSSPHILLLSGIGPKDILDNVGIKQVHNLPGVGKNLHNHVTFYLTYALNRVKDTYDLDWEQALNYILYHNGPLSSTGLSQLTGRINTKYEPNHEYPDLQIFFYGFLANSAQTGVIGDLQDPSDPNAPKLVRANPVNLHAKSRGYISLKSSDPFEKPLIYANYLKDADDLNVVVEGIRVVQNMTRTKVLTKKYGIEYVQEEYGNCSALYKFDTDDYWKCAIRYATGPENHQAGSCKMGPSSDQLAVVSNKLEVHGISNLRVIDASIMPVVISGNTHATCVMIGEKGVDYIKEKWLSPSNSTDDKTETDKTETDKSEEAGSSSEHNKKQHNNKPRGFFNFNRAKDHVNRHGNNHKQRMMKENQYKPKNHGDGHYY